MKATDPTGFRVLSESLLNNYMGKYLFSTGIVGYTHMSTFRFDVFFCLGKTKLWNLSLQFFLPSRQNKKEKSLNVSGKKKKTTSNTNNTFPPNITVRLSAF